MRVLLGLLVVGAVVVGLWVNQCSGPRPELVGNPTVRAPDRPGDAYHVEATVRNSGPGHGEVQVIFRLRDRATGRLYQRDETAQLDRGEQANVVAEIFAPPAEYEPEVDVQYPPE